MSSAVPPPPSDERPPTPEPGAHGQDGLRDCEQALHAARQLQRTFAHGISHELRGPLRAIDGFAAQIAADPGGSEALAHVTRIRDAAARMARLIDALLDFSHVEQATLRPQRVDLSLLADWTAAELQDADPARRAEIVIEPGLFAQGDERQLKLLMTQLLDNAWKFSRERDRVRIEITGTVVDGRMRMAIRDHGAGFDMRYADKLFQPFQRLHGADYPGNGMGLAIAQRIAQRHGGGIGGRAEADAGTTFVLELPVAEDRGA